MVASPLIFLGGLKSDWMPEAQHYQAEVRNFNQASLLHFHATRFSDDQFGIQKDLFGFIVWIFDVFDQ